VSRPTGIEVRAPAARETNVIAVRVCAFTNPGNNAWLRRTTRCARLKALVHLRNGPQSTIFADVTATHDRKNGVDRCNREHPAGFNQEIYGFGGHLRESAGNDSAQYSYVPEIAIFHWRVKGVANVLCVRLAFFTKPLQARFLMPKLHAKY